MGGHAQTPRAIVMIRPSAFRFNEETAGTNLFQNRPEASDPRDLQARAAAEFDGLVAALERQGVHVIVFDDLPERAAPDAVFPNNWMSTHEDGTVVLYPMFAPVRRRERRADIVDALQSRHGFVVSRVVDLSRNEQEGRFLEGTGSIVFDYANRSGYASVSPRTHVELAREVTGMFGYDLVVFHATDAGGLPVYHTNVVLSIGERFAVLCDEAIADPAERGSVIGRLSASGHEVVLIERSQMARFAANVLEVEGEGGGKVLVMSDAARAAFRPDQLRSLEKHARIVSAPLDTIESVNGGSARCMMASVHLPRQRPPQ